jgi:hypothetical protein
MLRKRFFLCLSITILLGLRFFALRGTAVDGFANHANGSLYVIAWIFFTLVLAPRLAPLPVCIAALLGTCAIDFLQLWHPPLLEAVRATLPGRLVLGSTFMWGDFPAYGIGALLGWIAVSRMKLLTPISND